MRKAGYYRNPTIGKNKIVFVADDDLWAVPLAGEGLNASHQALEKSMTLFSHQMDNGLPLQGLMRGTQKFI